MKIVGLVGRSGTGKSTIAAHLASRGAGHIDADRIAHDVLDDDGVRTRILARFGGRVVKDDRVDRSALGEAVFSDPDALQALNRIVHPLIIDRCVERLEECRLAGLDLVVIDAALLLDVPVPFKVDLMIALACSEDELVRRLTAKGGWTEGQLRARLANQAHIEKSFYRADVVVDTERPMSEVLTEIERMVNFLLKGDPE